MKKLLFVFFLFLSIIAGAQKKNASTYANGITADDLKKNLFVIASKEMEGRETAMPGQKKRLPI